MVPGRDGPTSQGSLLSGLPTSYPRATADGRYKSHAALYMPRASANSGHIHNVPRPSTSMRGGRFRSHAQPLGTGASHATAHGYNPISHAVSSAVQDVLASRMAAQLLMYAGHPAFASYARVSSPLPDEYYDFPATRQGQHQTQMDPRDQQPARYRAASSSGRRSTPTYVARTGHSISWQAEGMDGTHIQGGKGPVQHADQAGGPQYITEQYASSSVASQHVAAGCLAQAAMDKSHNQPAQELQWQCDNLHRGPSTPPTVDKSHQAGRPLTASIYQAPASGLHGSSDPVPCGPSAMVGQQQTGLSAAAGPSLSFSPSPPGTPTLIGSTPRPRTSCSFADSRPSSSPYTGRATGQGSQALRPSSSKTGWMNAMGDLYDIPTGTWVRLPYEQPDEHQLTACRRASAWHVRHVLTVAMRWWSQGYMTYRHNRSDKLARASRHCGRSLKGRALYALTAVRAASQALSHRLARAALHHTARLRRRGFLGWREACCRLRVDRARAAGVARHMARVQLRQYMGLWQIHLNRCRCKAAVLARATTRLATCRKRACLRALALHTAARKHERFLSVRALQHHHREVLARAWHWWRFLAKRSRQRAVQLQRHEKRMAGRMVHMAFFAWRSALLEHVREALTEQVYDLKREVAWAVGWSD